MNAYCTQLPESLEKTLIDHNETMWEIAKFLHKNGIKPDGYWIGKDFYTRVTRMSLELRHDNDYIEMGIGDADPEGKMFHIITKGGIEVSFPGQNMKKVLEFLENLSHKENWPKHLSHVWLNLDSWNVELKAKCTDQGKLEIFLKFDIRHFFTRSTPPIICPPAGGVV